jgi:hypothetical protein
MPVVTEPSVRSPALHRWWAGHLGHRLVREVVLVGVLFVGYRQVRVLTRDDGRAAMDNAMAVIEFERRIALFNERALQRALLAHEPVIAFLNRYYVSVHFAATAVFFAWVYARHHHAYSRVRLAFVVVTTIGLVLHVVYPLAPPRMFHRLGFVDTLMVYGPRIYSSDTVTSVANQFAAMPSLHFGWSVLVAAGVVLIKRTIFSVLFVLHPIITLVAIVATANHFWLDALVALLLVLAAGAITRLAPQRRFIPPGRPAPVPDPRP